MTPFANPVQPPRDGFALLNAVPAQVAVLNRDGVVCWVNAAWRRSAPPDVGIGARYTTGSAAAFETGPDGLAELEGVIRSILSGERESATVEYASRQPAAGGGIRLTFSRFRDGEFEGVVVMQSAVTGAPDPPRQEEDRRRQAEKMEAVGRLVGGVAHDFANLLTMISGYSEIVLNRMNAAEPLRSELEEIRKAANRGSRLTSQLLGFSRGQAVQPKVLDLNALVFDLEKMLRPIIGEHVELVTDLSPELGRIKADPGHMEQVIMNLVLNARDAMPRGGRITIETRNLQLDLEAARSHALIPGPYVVLALTDTGEGMDTDTMAHLFHPFFTTKEKGKGTGLGLSTVYGVVKQNHGDVWAQSQPGHGATFTICLPRAEGAGDAVEAGAPTLRAVRCAGTETILLVEDEDGVRRLLKYVLARQGYTVLEAPDGPEAIEVLEKHGGPVHLLLTDMVMPRMSGREVAEQVTRLYPGIKVIYMSGYTDDVLLRTGALGPDMTFLRKPLKPEALSAKVREILDAPARAVEPNSKLLR